MSTPRVILVAVVVLAGLSWLAWQELWAHGGDTAVAWTDLTDRTRVQPRAAGLVVFRNRREPESEFPNATVPPIDFSKRTAILVSSGPRSSTAYDLEVVSVVEERRRIVVTVRERAPSLAEPGVAALSYPFRLITIERSTSLSPSTEEADLESRAYGTLPVGKPCFPHEPPSSISGRGTSRFPHTPSTVIGQDAGL